MNISERYKNHYFVQQKANYSHKIKCLSSFFVLINHLIDIMQKKHQLREKLDKSESFYHEMLKAEQDYVSFKINAHYENLSSINQNLVTKFETTKKLPIQIYFVYGVFLDEEKVKMDLITQYFVTVFPKPQKPYIFVYFNDHETKNNFANFKNMLSIMPVQYFINLEMIYLVRPSFKMKAAKFFTFGTIMKYLNNKTTNVDSLEELSGKINVGSQQIAKVLPVEVKKYLVEQEQKNLEPPKNLRRNQSNTSNKSEISSEGNKLAASQNPSLQAKNSNSSNKPQQTNQIKKMELQQYDKSQRGIPVILQVLFHYFRQNVNELELQGIFRKSANIEQQTLALQKLHKKQYNYVETIKDPHLIANLIKRFFSKLKTPIIPYNIFLDLMQSNDYSTQFLSEKCRQLQIVSNTNYLTLVVLLDFANRKVISRKMKNKMSAQNMGICFAPCLMWAEQKSMKDLVYINKSVKVVVTLLNNFEQIFGNKKEVTSLIRSSYYEQQKKNIVEIYNIQPLHHVKSEQVFENRKTPNFGLLILNKNKKILEEQNSQDQLEEDKKLPQPYQITIHTIGPKANTDQVHQIQQQQYNYQKQHNVNNSSKSQKSKNSQKNAQLSKQEEEQQQKMERLTKRGHIFRSHIQTQARKEGENDDTKSNKSNCSKGSNRKEEEEEEEQQQKINRLTKRKNIFQSHIQTQARKDNQDDDNRSNCSRGSARSNRSNNGVKSIHSEVNE